MPRLVLALVAVLLLPAAAGAQPRWWKAYEDGLDAYKKGNLALAEQKMLEARSAGGPKQSRKANVSATAFRPFIPDYYLGLIAAQRGQHAEAKELLERAIGTGLVTPADKNEFAAAQTALERARTQLLAVNRPPDKLPDKLPDKPVDKPVEKPVEKPPPLPSPPAWLAAFNQRMASANALLKQARYADALDEVGLAGAAAGDARSRGDADALRRRIETARNDEADAIATRARAAIGLKQVDSAADQIARLAALVPEHGALPRLKTELAQLRGALKGVEALASAERVGVRLFLQGRYKDAAMELERAVGTGVKSTRIYLFLASSRAAQALLAPEAERPGHVAEARRYYQLARNGGNAPTADERFISPSILRLLKES
jgi:hypothetical protein